MSKYNPKEFIAAYSNKTNGRNVPDCPYCGGKQFTSTNKLAKILIDEELDQFTLGPNIPSGMIICENCGHIEFFALGSLGLLNSKGESNDA